MVEGRTPTGTTEQALPPATETGVSQALTAKLENLRDLEHIVEASLGPRQVIVITNGGDAAAVRENLAPITANIFRADNAVAVMLIEEEAPRGQFLGVLDALRRLRREGQVFDPDSVALGIALAGKGTRLSPITQRLGGIKPLMPLLIRPAKTDHWLNSAAASLYSWTLVSHHLQRMGFRGIAWKWGDEPQFAGRRLSQLNLDLSGVDAVRFGATVEITDDLAEHKEWLVADRDTAALIAQVRRRPRDALLRRLDAASGGRPVRTLVHLGSPAFSHVFLDEADGVFGDLPGALDVDGYLFEALTQDVDTWEAELRRDVGLQKLVAETPDFYSRVQALKQRIAVRRGHAPIIKVVDFGEHVYWGDIGQLAKARAALWEVNAATDDGEFARCLAGLEDAVVDRFGNRLIGDTLVPDDGCVRNSVIIDSTLHGSADIDGGVIVGCQFAKARIAPGAVAYGCTVGDFEVGAQGFAFKSIARRLRVPAFHAHTSIPADPVELPLGLQDWFADMRLDVGSGATFTQAQFGNSDSFAAKLAQMRRQRVAPKQLEPAIDELFRQDILNRFVR